MKLTIFYKYSCYLLVYLFFLTACSKPTPLPNNYNRNEVVFLELNTNLYKLSNEYNTHFQNGVKLALKEINANGGINGKKVRVFYKNDNLSFSVAKKSILESKDTEALAAFGTYFSMPSLGAITGANEIQLPFLNCSYEDSYIYSKNNKYSYNLRPGLYASLKALANEASKIPNLNRWLIITYSNDASIKAVKVFEKELIRLLQDKKDPKAENRPTNLGGYMFKYIYISSFKKYDLLNNFNLDNAISNVKAVLIITNGQDIQNLIDNSYLKQKLSNKIIFYPFVGEPEWFRYTKDNLTPINWIVTGYPWYSINNNEHKLFYSNYYSTYKRQPRYASLLGYLSIYVLTNTAKQVNLNEPDIYKLRNEFNKCLSSMVIDKTPLGTLSVRQDHIVNMGVYTGNLFIYSEKIFNSKNKAMLLKDIRMQDLSLYNSEQLYLKNNK